MAFWKVVGASFCCFDNCLKLFVSNLEMASIGLASINCFVVCCGYYFKASSKHSITPKAHIIPCRTKFEWNWERGQLCTSELSEMCSGTILELSWNYPGITSELRRNRPFILCFHGFLSGQFLLPVPLIKILLKAQGVGTTSRERPRTGAS